MELLRPFKDMASSSAGKCMNPRRHIEKLGLRGSLVQLQISEKERDVELSSLFKDVASIIAEKCINPKTQRPYTVTMIERALRDCHFSVDPKRSAKQQALQVNHLTRPMAGVSRQDDCKRGACCPARAFDTVL